MTIQISYLILTLLHMYTPDMLCIEHSSVSLSVELCENILYFKLSMMVLVLSVLMFFKLIFNQFVSIQHCS